MGGEAPEDRAHSGAMAGYVDLHCHYVPSVDDGVRTLAESQSVLLGLAKLGYSDVVATPHIRTAMFENEPAPLLAAFQELERMLPPEGLPALSLAAEHFCDDVFFQRAQAGRVLPYPGKKAILVEFRYETWPRGIEVQLFQLALRGLSPVIAHPERYHGLFRSTDALDPLLDGGAFTLLDTMSLVGRYGEHVQRAAERMLEEGAYDAACSDAHRPDDIAIMGRAMDRLRALVGAAEAESLLGTNPRGILRGTYNP